MMTPNFFRHFRDVPSPAASSHSSLVGTVLSVCWRVICLSALAIAPSVYTHTAIASSSTSHHSAFSGLLNTVGSARAGSPNKSVGSSNPEEFYAYSVEPVVQAKCIVCHKTDGAAANWNPPARLLFTSDSGSNREALDAFIALEGVGADWLLAKIVGEENHGGARVVTAGSPEYQSFSNYLESTTGGNTNGNAGGTSGGTATSSDFWRDTALESRETTLRRAAFLVGGTLPSKAAIARAKQSEDGLRAEILKLMQGEGFHDFLISGANDRLLTSGLNAGIDFQFDFRGRFPEFAEFTRQLPEEIPEELNTEPYWNKPFLTRNDAENEFRRAVIREPIELIAYIVENGRSYKEVVTADYTMVNAFSSIAYRSGVAFDTEFTDENGFYDRSQFTEFTPAKNHGHIPHDDEFYWDEEEWRVASFSGYQEWPHAGVLSTPAWLARYPSTDTNRNRARSRWTYFHFLDFDIEKSAPRTTDPVALADTNNPTMNNPACTVCHVRMDPVAGSYQSFGDQGHYLDQHGGNDSLPDSYKHPEWYGGEYGSTGYQEGDTWYRDMRTPGFEGTTASGDRDSLQWLGQQIANDPRFPVATVKFWWPAIFGDKALAAPEDPDIPGYQARLNAYNAQQLVISELAENFAAGSFRAKQLFADMIMSPWFRTSEMTVSTFDDDRAIELESVGSGRVLTPEELDRKNRALFGRTWGEQSQANPHQYERSGNFSNPWSGYAAFYGGIDGASVTVRNREMTPLMSNVSEKMAVDFACQVVLDEFSKPAEDRGLLNMVEADTDPLSLAAETWELERSPSVPQDQPEIATKALTVTTSGELVLRFDDVSPNGCVRDDARSTDTSWEGWCSHVGIEQVSIIQNNRMIKRLTGEEIERYSGFASDTWTDQETGETHPSGWTHYWDDKSAWMGHTNAWFELAFDLTPGTYEIRVNWVFWFNEGHPEDSVQARLAARTVDFDPAGPNAVQVAEQLDTLYMATTHRQLTDGEREALMLTLIDAASQARVENGGHVRGHCDTWSLWNGPEYENNNAFWDALWRDPTGYKAAWTMLLHSLLTDFSYLHD